MKFKYDHVKKNEFTPLEIIQEMEKRRDMMMIDVREPVEVKICHIESARHIPMGEIPAKIDELPKDKDLVVFCHMGVRSKQVMNYLRKNGFSRVYNLKGGIDRWSVEVDPKVQRYR
ncbi:rhodanese-like domain-containing protein [Marinifilum sp. D714]|uniref:rhodanese-like domain-containing protein n=1 Tax=Marinifilum sp. D714 TaxID=2937523 RepID=UPI0027C263F4|nr:rhodanese-like domain-containing protein [Marinifilum sp. D714]MDQ2179936.1 rhodanese-like domain-containing protein [Marinifilum sp. D714]